MIILSDHEMLKALGYEEDNSPKYSDSVEATVQLFKKHARHTLNY